jgi:hypothetical protein
VAKSDAIELDKLRSRLKLPIDVFICSASFEERCKSIPDQLDPHDVAHVIVCENEDLKSIVEPNSLYLQQRFSGKSNPVYLDTTNPIKSADNIQKALQQTVSDKPVNYLIDITTFTHESLLILIKLMKNVVITKDSIQFVYTSAADYAVGMELKEKWLSKGIGDIRSVLGYPGRLLPSRKIHLIVLVGFENDRAEKLIEKCEPALVSLGFGKAEESVNREHHKANVYFHDILSQKRSDVYDFTFSCIDPIESEKAIEAQISKFPDHNVVIAAMNTKISTVGAALVALKNENIQLCYAHAHQYNYEKYSMPSTECYVFELPQLTD